MMMMRRRRRRISEGTLALVRVQPCLFVFLFCFVFVLMHTGIFFASYCAFELL
jgi:hypothetical protein